LQGFLGGLQAKNNKQYYDKVAAYANKYGNIGAKTLGNAGVGIIPELDVDNMSERAKYSLGL